MGNRPLQLDIVKVKETGFLDLSKKGLKQFPKGLSNEIKGVVTRIALNDNELPSLPSEIVRFINLTELDLSNNTFNEIPLVLVQFLVLTKLNLCNHRFLPSLEQTIACSLIRSLRL